MRQAETEIAQGVQVAVETFLDRLPGVDLTGGQFLVMTLLFAGMVLHPLLMVFLGRVRLRNPLRDRGGLAWLLAGGGMVYAGGAIAGNGGPWPGVTLETVLQPLWHLFI